jgi:ABC-type hemin transport system ATPase subunit
VGLYVDSYDTLMVGSSRGKVITPGDPGKSTLIQRLTGEVQPRMPLNRPSMSEKEIAIIETWILEGAANN